MKSGFIERMLVTPLPRGLWQQTSFPLNVLYSALIVYALLGAIFGQMTLIGSRGLLISTEASWLLSALAALLIWCFCNVGPRCRRFLLREAAEDTGSPGLRLLPEVFLFGLLLFVFSDAPARSFGFSVAAESRGLVLYCGLLFLLWHGIVNRKTLVPHLLCARAVFFCQVFLLVLFIATTKGRMLFNDDHPSFVYRFSLLAEHFPLIPFYNTDWNAGYSTRELLMTGALNVYFICLPFWPFLKLFSSLPSAHLYVYIVGYLFIFVMPWSVFFAARILRCPAQTAALAALLSLAPSLGYFEWFLKYGTLGFSASAALLPLTLALLIRLAFDDLPRWSHLLASVICLSLCLSWTPSVFAFVPLALLCLIYARRVFSKKRLSRLFVFCALSLALNAPWISAFVAEHDVVAYVAQGALPGSDVKSFRRALQVKQSAKENTAQINGAQPSIELRRLIKMLGQFREVMIKVNPVILLLAIPGLLLWPAGSMRAVIAATVLWLTMLAAIGDSFLPQLELRRMIIAAAFLAAIPAAHAAIELISHWWYGCAGRRTVGGDMRTAVLTPGIAVLFGSLVLTAVTAAVVYSNRSSERFLPAPAIVEKLSAAIHSYGGSGRTIFISHVLHDVGSPNASVQTGGHVAPLAAFSGKELYGSHFYHARWSAVDPVPEAYRERGRDGIEEFLDLLNVTAVVTLRPKWRDYCKSDPRYLHVFRDGHIDLFSRHFPEATFVFRGQGQVERTSEGFSVIPVTTELVLKYRYLEKLRAAGAPGVEIFPVPVFWEDVGGKKTEQFSFVGLRVPPEVVKQGQRITVGYYAK